MSTDNELMSTQASHPKSQDALACPDDEKCDFTKRIAVDTTFFGHDETRKKQLSLSTSIFTASILDSFSRLGLSKNFTLFVSYNHAEFFRQRFPDYNIEVLKFFPIQLLNKLSLNHFKGTKFLKKLPFFKNALERGNFDAVWFPFCQDYTFVKSRLVSICTVHDIFPVHRKKTKLGWDFITDENCVLTTISDFSKDDIVRTFGLSHEKAAKIRKIPNSIKLENLAKKEIPGLSDTPFILNLNAYVAKKNPFTMLKAFNLIKDKIPQRLVFCGGYKDDKLFQEMEDYIRENGLTERVTLLFNVSDEERNFLLSQAMLFVTTSLFEGFGRTPVEAAIFKTPVISTKEASLFEATLGLCNYTENPTDENELAALILEKINNPDSDEKLSQIAQKLIDRYDADKIARCYLDLFKELPAKTMR